jgi:DnaK suppressor protein
MPKKRKKMDKKTLKEFENLLLQRKSRLITSINGSLNALKDDKEERNVLNIDDLGSAAKAVEEEDVACILAENESQELEFINEALNKIKNGTFGICDDCDDPIPLARLEALPNATLCLKCKIVSEKRASNNSKNNFRSNTFDDE